MSWIMTYTGKKFYPLNPRIEDIDIEDIAHALSMKCRYTGHCNAFYSVAQHSYIASLLSDRNLALTALMHDASEAYLPDVARPIKPYLNGFCEIENHLLELIFKKFGLEYPISAAIKLTDSRLCLTEAISLGFDVSEWELATKYHLYNIPIFPVGPEKAKELFMGRFKELNGNS